MRHHFLSLMLTPMFQVRSKNMPVAMFSSESAGERLSTVIGVVTDCCHLALEIPDLAELCGQLNGYPEEQRGFAYEGAGVGLAALDLFTPWMTARTQHLVDNAFRYRYAIYLGAGMAMARVCHPPLRFLKRLTDPVFKWVLLDGYGFHEGLFRHTRCVKEQHVPSRLRRGRSILSIFDQGVGRSLWFTTGANIDGITRTIASFPRSRQADLWAGVGLACSYTGGADAVAITELAHRAGRYLDRLAEGASVGAYNRHVVGNADSRNHTAVEILCGRPVPEIAALATRALSEISLLGADEAYMNWRALVRCGLNFGEVSG